LIFVNDMTIGRFKWLITLALCLVAGATWGQTVDGQIVDAQGKGIPAATVYVRETAQGMMADEDGRFRFEIAAGVYISEASSLGYERKTLNINVPPEGLKINIVLTEVTQSQINTLRKYLPFRVPCRTRYISTRRA
jgi:hypothetical protein